MSEDENPVLKQVLDFQAEIQHVLEEMNAANTGALRCRELSLALTNIEQGSLWLSALLARLDNNA